MLQFLRHVSAKTRHIMPAKVHYIALRGHYFALSHTYLRFKSAQPLNVAPQRNFFDKQHTDQREERGGSGNDEYH